MPFDGPREPELDLSFEPGDGGLMKLATLLDRPALWQREMGWNFRRVLSHDHDQGRLCGCGMGLAMMTWREQLRTTYDIQQAFGLEPYAMDVLFAGAIRSYIGLGLERGDISPHDVAHAIRQFVYERHLGFHGYSVGQAHGGFAQPSGQETMILAHAAGLNFSAFESRMMQSIGRMYDRAPSIRYMGVQQSRGRGHRADIVFMDDLESADERMVAADTARRQPSIEFMDIPIHIRRPPERINVTVGVTPAPIRELVDA